MSGAIKGLSKPDFCCERDVLYTKISAVRAYQCKFTVLIAPTLPALHAYIRKLDTNEKDEDIYFHFQKILWVMAQILY